MAGDKAPWVVVGQSPTTKMGDIGGFVDGFDVTFTTDDGHHGSVFIPRDQYNVEHVRDVVDALASQMRAVAALNK